MRSHEKYLLRGRKLGNTHTSTIQLVRQVIKLLKPLPSVNKITLGPIKRIGAGASHIKLQRDPRSGQALLKCRGNNCIQLLWCLGDVDAIAQALRRLEGVRVTCA